MPTFQSAVQSAARTIDTLTGRTSRLTVGVAAASAAAIVSAAGMALAGAGTPPGAAASLASDHVPVSPASQAGGVSASATVGTTSPSAVSTGYLAHQAGDASASATVGTAAPSAVSTGYQTAPADKPIVPAARLTAGMQLAGPVPARHYAITPQRSSYRGHVATSGHAAAPAPAAAAAGTQAQSQAQPAATPAQPAAPSQPYEMYDSVTPSTLPAGAPAAVYADGNFAAQPSEVTGHSQVLWIDTNGSDPGANVLDVEPGDATPAGAATWVAAKLDASPNSVAIVYTMESEWPAVQAAINALPWWMPSHTRYWIADPTGIPHIVPGSSATQWYWGQNYDESLVLPGF